MSDEPQRFAQRIKPPSIDELRKILKSSLGVDADPEQMSRIYGQLFRPPVLQKAQEFPRILAGLDVDKTPLPVGSNVGGEDGEGTLVATLKIFSDGTMVCGWETPSAVSGLSIRGTPGPGKVACARQYESDAPDAAIIPAGSESGPEHWFLTYDYQRSVAV